MPEKPLFASDYKRKDIELVRQTCLYVATKLGDLLDDLVVVDGLVPSLLIPDESLPVGEDVHTNAAICGALLGAVCGREAIPARWLDSLQNCRPEAGQPRVRHPRPKCFWPVDVLELAEKLIGT